MINVLLVDDHALVRTGIRRLLEDSNQINIVGETESGESSINMAAELNTIFGTENEGPLAGMVRFEPLNRLNALLVVSTQSAYLKKAEEWIKRLDRSSESSQDLYVYYLQNAKAADMA